MRARRRATGRSIPLALAVGLLVAGPVGAAVAAHHEFRLSGLAATPVWWSWSEAFPESTRYDVGPLATGVSVRAHAVGTFVGTTLHLYAYRVGDGGLLVPVAQDPLPAREKWATLAGPGSFVVVVDVAATPHYRLLAEFDGAYGDPGTGAPAAFALEPRGTYRCPLPWAVCP